MGRFTTGLGARRLRCSHWPIATPGKPEALELFRKVLPRRRFRPCFRRVSSRSPPEAPSTTRCMWMAAQRARSSCCRRNLWPRRQPAASGSVPIRRAYIIRNGHVAPEYKAVKARTLSIAGRAVSSLIKSQGVGDLYELVSLRQEKQHRLQPCLYPRRFPRYQHANLRSGLYDQALRSRLQHGSSRLSVEESAAAHGGKLTRPDQLKRMDIALGR